MYSNILDWQGPTKEFAKKKQSLNNSLNMLRYSTEEDVENRSSFIRDSRSMKRMESMSRTPSPATISKRKRGMRGSLWSTTGSLPFGGAWISAASFDADAQEQQSQDLVLDPVEHAWMIMAAEGNFEDLQDSLQQDPSLLYKRDFVTGYSVIHWIAKHGHHEDLIRLMDFVSAGGYFLDINTRASGGLTSLHIAALQGHDILIKVLVGAYNADIHIRDHNGRKAWQYLKLKADRNLFILLGAPEDEENGAMAGINNNNNSHGATLQKMTPRDYDELDSLPKVALSVAPFRNFIRSAYSFLKNW
ncbi:ankyrin repeat domain-containing protein SOWAHD [Hyla sarda]|uniref:ankyrin repeat domain-containing protein SOWAHD n=1 Tax=Hyla sarda TaxID=327740 RepID=UPI0024C2CC97|nr:ankyrin repeat domain-containing protein SOWAHD [Hyla sarda]XP_056397155.1 ankyrin repeat domain-containing protein SOWAHD [Hyla sarda]XP_056397157.1 ankyrin repeat domain-containing protein SOWAHD [Hyla sarda]XP_056397158.1 ankyrin repeat domain-containing protein SOWAHD [Hyla sarda]XP_056397159.1 ankyrin repeat domain-containing protein SOWAHD [Hyla sarda]